MSEEIRNIPDLDRIHSTENFEEFIANFTKSWDDLVFSMAIIKKSHTDPEPESSLLPDQAGKSGKFLITKNGMASWSDFTVVYEDLQVSISNVRVPASSAPTERLHAHGIGSGVTFPSLGFALNDYLYFTVQTHHAMKLKTILDNHIHFMTPTDGSGTPDRFQFQLDVIAAALNGNYAVPTGSPFTKEHTIAADYSNTHKLQDLADIPAVNTTVSTLYKCKLTRIAATQDEYGEEVYVDFMDYNYQKYTMGSRKEGAK